MAGRKTPNTAKHTPSSTTSESKPTTTSNSTPASSTALQTLWNAYLDTTTSRLKTIDAFLVSFFCPASFSSCIAYSFASTVGQFVLTASLRSQVNASSRALFKDVSPERAFADFVVGSIVLHFFVFNFLG
ncbi:hypothetical protein B0F90DRAFT_1747651 [Multifurca ochricompacta]|uniref:Dolichyl-diphosphooligosaccharide--protein glycosyltransferase subunit OST2 n=1 Tax=Multifurca ochricompacta TaxID=376703 RepID=A0AAD4LYZ4_9AGAM|nr:hypothetical protein B0F90DRAFT_1747651 [Multifurca ochricompacta]